MISLLYFQSGFDQCITCYCTCTVHVHVYDKVHAPVYEYMYMYMIQYMYDIICTHMLGIGWGVWNQTQRSS